MTLLSYCAAFIVICIACYTDMKRYEVSNKLCIATLISGMMFNMMQLHMSMFWWTVASMVGLFLLLLLLYIAKGMGAGDVKFLSSLTFLIGAQKIWILVLIAFLIAGFIALLLYALKGAVKLYRYLSTTRFIQTQIKQIPFMDRLFVLSSTKQIPFMIAVLPAFILLCYNEVIQ